MNFAFAGAPEFAAWVLRDLEALGRRPTLVITQPDRPRGRGRRPSATPAAVEAGRLAVPCWQLDDISSSSVIERLQAESITTLVVAAFGQMLKRDLLEALLCLNVHASLLPAYRGAAPIQRALAAGEERTGVTIMRIIERLDEGPWALQREISVGLHDDAGAVGRLLALAGAIGIDQVLTGMDEGKVTWTDQQGPSSYAGKVCAMDCFVDTGRGAKAVHDLVRSLSPSIGARVNAGGLELKVWRTWPYGQAGLDPVPQDAAAVAGRAGKVAVRAGRLFVGCGEGVVEVLVLQPAGKGRMTAGAFLRGYQGRLGDFVTPAAPGCGPGEVEEGRGE